MFLYDIMTEESFLLTIGPPIITELMYDGFTCDVSLEVISLEISWTVSIILLYSVTIHVSLIVILISSCSCEKLFCIRCS